MNKKIVIIVTVTILYVIKPEIHIKKFIEIILNNNIKYVQQNFKKYN